jgi:hypothetical protein
MVGAAFERMPEVESIRKLLRASPGSKAWSMPRSSVLKRIGSPWTRSQKIQGRD